MDRSHVFDRAAESQHEHLPRHRRERARVAGRPLQHAAGAEPLGEFPPRLAEVGHVQGASNVRPIGMSGGMVPDGEEDLGIGLSGGLRPPRRGRLSMEEGGSMAERPRIGLLSRRPDGSHRFFRWRAPERVMEPRRPNRSRVPIGRPGARYLSDRGGHGLHVREALGAQPGSDDRPEPFRRQSAPCRTYGWTIEPCGIVVCAIRFHPLSSTPRPRCALAIRVNGPITDSRPTLETPSMMTPG